jgi:DNA-binding transcriptional LysR family regulator
MNTPFTIRQLEVYTRIAQGNSLTQTAEQLGISQSAASMALSELEKALQGPLFNRISRRLVLNDRGRQLLPKAQVLIQTASEITNSLINGDNSPKGHVVMGCSTTIASYWLPPLLKSFYAEHSGIEIHLGSGNTDTICKDLIDGKIDFGLVEGDINYEILQETYWATDNLAIIAPPNAPNTETSETKLESLKNEKWILREKGSGTRSTFETTLQKEGIHLENVMVLGHTESIKRAVENNLGISCLSHRAVERELELGFLTEINTQTKLSRWFRLVTVKGQYISPLVKYVIDNLYRLSLQETENQPK